MNSVFKDSLIAGRLQITEHFYFNETTTSYLKLHIVRRVLTANLYVALHYVV